MSHESTVRCFAAPWSGALRLITGLTAAALVILVVVALLVPPMPLPVRLAMIIIPPLSLAAGALFAIRGYELTTGSLLVLRPAWKTRIPLAGLKSVVADPKATCRTLRTCGNGGFFSFTGWYYNKTLGAYRMFATDPARAVVLAFEKRRVVVTPDDPDAFVRSVSEQFHLAR
jgi:hypothetical protein